MPAVSPGHRILVVDDDEVFRTVLARALARRGFDVRSAADVPQAIAMLDGFVPEYAVVDLRMPGPSGLELIAALHARRATMRIVVLTGYASVATAVEAIKLGATHYLAKPADADQVIAALGMTDLSEKRKPPLTLVTKMANTAVRPTTGATAMKASSN